VEREDRCGKGVRGGKCVLRIEQFGPDGVREGWQRRVHWPGNSNGRLIMLAKSESGLD